MTGDLFKAMTIRLAENKDTEALKKMWLDIFDDSEKFVEWNFKYNYNPQNVVLCEEEGEIVSALHLISYDVKINSKTYKAVYISAVATLEKMRGCGFASKVLNFALDEIKVRGADIAFLVPAIDGFYEKFGFLKVLEKEEICFRKDAKDIEITDSKDAVFEIFSECMKNKDNCLLRSRNDMALILDDATENTKGEVKVLPDNSGYVIFKNEKDRVLLFEIMAKNEEAKEKLLGYLGSFGKEIKITLPPVMIKAINEKIGINPEEISRYNSYFNLIL